MNHKTYSIGGEHDIPVGPLGIIPMQGTHDLARLVDQHLVTQRKNLYSQENDLHQHYLKESYLLSASCPRFSTGDGKGVINESVRGYDIYIISDVGNYSCTYKMFGQECRMSPDDHFQDIKRIISAIGGKARRINLIMPLLYAGRQHKRVSRESLDCAIALQELERLGVENILTFDAHDPRVQNAIPIKGFENILPTYQIIKALVNSEPELQIDRSSMMVVSPDEGGLSRNIYYANVLGLDLGMFYKRRDLTRLVNGKNPIIAHEFLGDSVEGKSVLIIDDILSSGDSIIDIVTKLKKRKAAKIYVGVTFALFTEGVDKFQELYERGMINKVFSTNLTYRREELRKAPWYVEVDMSKFLALLINTLNHDCSISSLLDPTEKIHALMERRKASK
ncbi:MAG TPA: ribose-phosphate pyrophosphokinase [Thermoclostridium caenicola]|uniref:ribose-phosphate pyrophosphokinase n=1 Tax=Thermoclostridium caenicola TaxID=659425 RepID=UPI002CFAF28B|nr:ribose-phosphate pyrophosphokinase [Thermoclostridium caenicola]HOL83757.1 ribose-phosphate pyrophosphokinase [Thermoclostridium caenicola]HPO75995.1 ribose-phosphate pyrophosphokinase [Thermoclostridium caenicola]